MKDVVPDFQLGETLEGTNSSGTLINDAILGRCYEFPVTEDIAAALGMAKRVSGMRLKAVALRNTSGGTYAAKDLVEVDLNNGFVGLTTASSASDAGDRFVAVVDFTLSGTVADDDIFWGIVAGPVTVKTAATDWAGGELIKAASGVATTATAGTDHGPVIIGTVVENTSAGATEAKAILHSDWAAAL